MKKLLALILSISMLIMCAPGLSLVASAEDQLFAGGTGKEGDPYLIETEEQFESVFSASGEYTSFVTDKDVHFKQKADIIVLKDYTPVYADIACTYDGDGKTIKIEKYNALGLPTNASSYQQQGLFRRFVNGIVKNLTVEGTIDASENNHTLVGGIVGFCNSGKVINCINKVNVTAQNSVGGIVGQSQNARIINCINLGTVKANNNIVGGVLGVSAGNTGSYITNCANYGTVIRIYDNVKRTATGGILGEAGGIITITNSFNAGNVNSSSKATVSAIVGTNSSSASTTLTINDCFNTGILSNAVSYHLLMGAYAAPASGKTFSLTVNNFYDIANPNAALIPANLPTGNSITNTYVLSENKANAQAIIDAYASNEAYECISGDGYDYPNFDKTDDIKVVYDTTFGITHEKPAAPDPDGSPEYPYLIATPEDFLSFFGVDGAENDKLSGGNFFKQTEDIVLADYTPANATFDGVYDGNSKKITIEKYTPCGTIANAYGQGLVSNLTGTIKNLTVAGKIGDNIHKYVSNGVGSTGYQYVGGFAGKSRGGTIINCVNEAEITGLSWVAGFIGEGINTTIKNSINKGNAIGRNSYVGGFIGYASGTNNIENCGNYGAIRNLHTGGRANNGGFVGQTKGNLSISKSFNAGDFSVIYVSSETKQYGVGSFVGMTVVRDNSNITITDCFNVGKVKAYTTTGVAADFHKVNSVIMAYCPDPEATFTHSMNITNFYDIADQEIKLVPESNTVTISTTNIIANNDEILSAFATNTAFEVADGYAYPNFKLTEDVTVKYDPALRVAVVDLAFAEGTPIFLSSDDTENTVVKTSDTNEVITTSYAIVNGKFAGVTSLNGVRYGVLITKDRTKSGTKLTADTATEIAYADRNLTTGGVAIYGMLIYGKNMVPGDTYYVRPFVECAGLYSYGTASSFVLPVKAE